MKSALSEALNIISRRMITTHQLKTKLCLKKYSEDEIKEAIIKLKNWNYLNDQEYANVFCRLKSGKYSRLRVKQELIIAGIDSEIITAVLRDSYSEELEYEYLKKIAIKYLEEERIRQTRTDDSKREDIFQKAAKKLFRKGFSYNSIHKVIEELENNYK